MESFFSKHIKRIMSICCMFSIMASSNIIANAQGETKVLSKISVSEDGTRVILDSEVYDTVTEEGWYVNENGDIYYYFSDGIYADSVVILPDGDSYLFASNGRLKTGWQTVNGKRYYYDIKTGQKYNGWIMYATNYYYISEDEGKLVGEAMINDTPYLFDEYGILQSGLVVHSDGTVSYCKPDGEVYTGWNTVDNNTYYFDCNGVAVVGLNEINNKTYYFNENGIMQTGEVTIDDIVYEFGKDGALISTKSEGLSYNVPYYNQGDERWGNVYIGTKTIKQVGCLVTALSMIESYSTGTSIYPDVMCKEYLAFDNNSVLWAPIIKLGYALEACSNLGSNDFYSTLYKRLSENGPVIVGSENSYGGTHYVVVTGCTNTTGINLKASDFTINDPGFYGRETLNQHLNDYPSWFRFFYKEA